MPSILVLFSRGIPQTRAAFGMKCFPDEAGCKLVFCLHRVARGVSISTTCLLSGFQALKFCSRNSWWIDFRIQCLKSIGFCSFLFWILQLVVNVCVPIRITGPRSGKNINVKTYYGYCSSLTPDKFMRLSRAVVLVLVDVVCLGCVIWTRGYMLFVLHRHKQKVQHIHSKTFPQTFPRGQSYMILRRSLWRFAGTEGRCRRLGMEVTDGDGTMKGFVQ
ncbi:vomeronasal type-1 receptor 4-like [Sus scrofa]|uniref:vomeronasal type-1 receptor 4-like n=1 Tax=Sus scrofa TaxID=9823 RepID=UPI000A2B1554|nr:vomeronasal type-1 receptor 4-like [Sus scrofa]